MLGVMHTSCVIHQRSSAALCIHASAAQPCATYAWASRGWGAICIQHSPQKGLFRPVNQLSLKRSVCILCHTHSLHNRLTDPLQDQQSFSDNEACPRYKIDCEDIAMLQQNNTMQKYRLTRFSKRVKLWGVGV